MPTQVIADSAGSLLTPSPTHDGQHPNENTLQAIAPAISVEDQILERFIARLAVREDVSDAGLSAIRLLVESRAVSQKGAVLKAVTEAEPWIVAITEQRPAAAEIAVASDGSARAEDD